MLQILNNKQENIINSSNRILKKLHSIGVSDVEVTNYLIMRGHTITRSSIWRQRVGDSLKEYPREWNESLLVLLKDKTDFLRMIDKLTG